jgi:glycosyltransferase involved in cell wall biosynthesis
MTRSKRRPDTVDSDERIARLEATVAALESVVAGHAASIVDLHRMGSSIGAGDPAIHPTVSDALASHTEWLSTLERWVSSCVKTLATFGAQPLDDSTPSASGSLDVNGSLMTRLEISTVTSWITDAARVNEDTLVSVTIATHNRPELLRQAVDSVLGQSYQRFELIIVDDSDDDTTDQLRIQFDDARIRILRTPARNGAGTAFNAGLVATTGDLITFLDDDNLMHRDWLRSIVWAFDSFPNVGALYGARIIEDPGASNGQRSGALPMIEFSRYDRARHELANYIDRNAIAYRSLYRDIAYDEELDAAFDWDHSLRLFALAEPLPLPVVACYYRTVVAGRISDAIAKPSSVRVVRARTHTTRPMRIHVHTAMYPLISETYIAEDIAALEAVGATITVSAVQSAVSPAVGHPLPRLDAESVIGEAKPDVILMHWTTHAVGELPLIERLGIPFACRVHSFDVDSDSVRQLLDHPLCIAVYAHPHHLPLLPTGVRPLLPSVGPVTVIPDSPTERHLVLSVSAGLPKKDFPLLIDAMAQLPDFERQIILARTNGVLDLPDQVTQLAGERDPGIMVRVNVPREQVLTEMARASVLVYTLVDEAVMGYPMSIIEAMLCGAIVVAPDRPEVHEIVGDHVRTYRNAEDIADHVRDIAKGGSAIDAEREDLRVRAQRHRDQAVLEQLHSSLSDDLISWRLRTK